MKICLLIIMVILPFIEHLLVADILHVEIVIPPCNMGYIYLPLFIDKETEAHRKG